MVKLLFLIPKERSCRQCLNYHISADSAKSTCCQRHPMLPMPTSNASCTGYSQHAAASSVQTHDFMVEHEVQNIK